MRWPSSRSAWRTQFRIDCAVGSNSFGQFLGRLAGAHQLDQPATKLRRVRWWADFFGIVDSSDPNGQVSTKPGQPRTRLGSWPFLNPPRSRFSVSPSPGSASLAAASCTEYYERRRNPARVAGFLFQGIRSLHWR